MEQIKRIGKNIKSFREKMGLSQDELAKFLKVQREMVSYYETGVREVPVENLKKLADLFGVEMYDLIEQDELASKANVAFAFRAQGLSDHDLGVISDFKRVVMNYIKLIQIKDKNELQF